MAAKKKAVDPVLCGCAIPWGVHTLAERRACRAKRRDPGWHPTPRRARKPALRFDMPAEVRAGVRELKRRRRAGEAVTPDLLDYEREYKRLRWAQLPEDRRRAESDRSNRARRKRDTTAGRARRT